MVDPSQEESPSHTWNGYTYPFDYARTSGIVLWEKHVDAILRNIGLTTTVHEPCLYLGIIQGKHVIFKWQGDNFAITAPDERTVNILFDMIDDEHRIPMKCQGYLDMYNIVDVLQAKNYIKISC